MYQDVVRQIKCQIDTCFPDWNLDYMDYLRSHACAGMREFSDWSVESGEFVLESVYVFRYPRDTRLIQKGEWCWLSKPC